MAMYHRENDQEDFLVLAGEALAIVEGEERPLRQWDSCIALRAPTMVVIGAGDGPCPVLAVGGRDRSRDRSGAYTVDEAAQGHGAGVERETNAADEAYARFPRGNRTRYREGCASGIGQARRAQSDCS